MKGHRWFAALYDRITAPAERGYMKTVRAEVAGGATGRILEIGAGTGANFTYYPAGADVVASEPDPFMLARARARAADAQIDIDLREASAEQLPFDDGSFETVVSTLVLCSVPDQAAVLSEIARVLRPSGAFRFFEHVRYANRIGALMQDAIAPVWSWTGAGCHPNRDTAESIRKARFVITGLVLSSPTPPVPPMIFTRPHIRGTAIRPGN